ncbi:N-acetyltransferase family protein [Paenibacillus tarimensis]
MSFEIRKILPEDWEDIIEIYLQGIRTGNATFQTEAPTKEEWFGSHILECSIGCFRDGLMLGWASLSKVSSRCVYAGVAEVSIYVKENARGQGIGDFLLKNLIRFSEAHGYWTLQSGIFPENNSSIKLHIQNGFREIGRRERIGKLDHVWRDVLLLERRSTVVGKE